MVNAKVLNGDPRRLLKCGASWFLVAETVQVSDTTMLN